MTSASDNPSEDLAADDPELSAAFVRGDFARVRARVGELLSDPSTSAQAREGAQRFYARVSADVVVYVVLAFALLVFCAIVLRYAWP